MTSNRDRAKATVAPNKPRSPISKNQVRILENIKKYTCSYSQKSRAFSFLGHLSNNPKHTECVGINNLAVPRGQSHWNNNMTMNGEGKGGERRETGTTEEGE